ncbi:MAG TPA: hypothetical protein VFJ72_00850, partial [Rubrobacteraceae bacterium]|nr:hypothetical protein [Rubrobacteraceae bacterium]
MREPDSAFVSAVTRAVEDRRDDAVRLLRALVNIPSVTGGEGAVAEAVAHAFRERGLDVDVWEATREEMEPYLEHVGEQETYAGRPNVVGRRAGSG